MRVMIEERLLHEKVCTHKTFFTVIPIIFNKLQIRYCCTCVFVVYNGFHVFI